MESLELSGNLRLDKIRNYNSYLDSNFELIFVDFGTKIFPVGYPF